MAANQLSPGVVVQERDLTTITSLSTANLGVIAAPFELGPVEEVVTVSSERDLVEKFGTGERDGEKSRCGRGRHRL